MLAFRPLNTRPWAPPEVTGQSLEEQKRNHIDKHPSNTTNIHLTKKYRHEIRQIMFCDYSFCGQTCTHDPIICICYKSALSIIYTFGLELQELPKSLRKLDFLSQNNEALSHFCIYHQKTKGQMSPILESL